jgi:thiamine-phosphate pyrophosphorylase
MSGPRLYLVTPRLAETVALAREIGDAVAAGDVAAVLVRLEPSDERTLINRLKAITDAVQRRDAALLVDGYPEIVARAGADGAHLTGVTALTAALNTLKPDRIAGVGGLHSRHDAMLAGEADADYVMFGEPDRLGVRLPLDALVERVEWWAELFQPPCVGYAASLDEVSPLTQAGADFVALGDWIWTHAQGPAAAVTAASRAAAAASREAPFTAP